MKDRGSCSVFIMDGIGQICAMLGHLEKLTFANVDVPREKNNSNMPKTPTTYFKMKTLVGDKKINKKYIITKRKKSQISLLT